MTNLRACEDSQPRASGCVMLPDTRIDRFSASINDDTLRIVGDDPNFWIEVKMTCADVGSSPRLGEGSLCYVNVPRDRIHSPFVDNNIYCTYFIKDRVFVFQCTSSPTAFFWIECTTVAKFI